MVMRRSRWCGILCSLLICSIVLMGLDLAFLGGKVSASTREKLAAPPKEGMSVSFQDANIVKELRSMFH